MNSIAILVSIGTFLLGYLLRGFQSTYVIVRRSDWIAETVKGKRRHIPYEPEKNTLPACRIASNAMTSQDIRHMREQYAKKLMESSIYYYRSHKKIEA